MENEEKCNQMKNEEKCNHDWENDSPITDEKIIREGDFIGFHVHCTICGVKAVEWFEYSHSEIENDEIENEK